MWQKIWAFSKANRDLFFFNAFLVVKLAALQTVLGLGGETLGVVLSTFCVLLLLSGWLVMLPFVVRFIGLLLFDLMITFVMFADLVYFRNFLNVIPLPMLSQANQVDSVADNLLTLISLQDLLLLSDLLFLVPYALVAIRNAQYDHQKNWKSVHSFKKRAIHATVVMTVSVSVLTANVWSTVQAEGKDVFQNLYSNDTVLRQMGVLGYHMADLYKNYGNDELDTSGDKVAELRRYIDLHRMQPQKMHGIAKGKNVLMVQLESMQGYLINSKIGGKEVTPNLNKLVEDTLYFDNYFTQIGVGITSDAEFMTLNSLHALPAGSAYVLKPHNTYQSLPKLLKDAGYSTYVFHGYKPEFYNRKGMYPGEGFDHFISQNEMKNDQLIGWGVSDESMYRQAVQKMKAQKGPWLANLISLTGHSTYEIPDSLKELNIPAGKFTQMFTDYLHAQHYADQALGKLLAALKKEKMLDDTLLIVYGDHFAFGNIKAQEVWKFLGRTDPLDYHKTLELRKVPLLIRLPGKQQTGVKHITGGQIDFYPTVANLLGIDRRKMFYFGQDLLNATNGYAAFRHYTDQGTFVTDDVFFIGGKHGTYEQGKCYDRKTGRQTELSACRIEEYQRGKWEFEMSDFIIETNALPTLLGIPSR